MKDLDFHGDCVTGYVLTADSMHCIARQLSGGERRRVALALLLGFADLISARGRLQCNLIVLDEVHRFYYAPHRMTLQGMGCHRESLLDMDRLPLLVRRAVPFKCSAKRNAEHLQKPPM